MSVDFAELLLDEGDSFLGFPAVCFKLRFARAAHADATDGLARKVGPHSGQPGKAVLELGQLNLQTTFVGLGPLGEYVQNNGGTIEHLYVKQLLEVTELCRRQFVIDDDQVVFERLLEGNDFFDLAFADVGSRDRMT